MGAPLVAFTLALLLVPPPRPVEAPSPTTAPLPQRSARGPRIAGGVAIGGLATAGLGVLTLLTIAMPGDLREQRELAAARHTWDFDARRDHYDRARGAARMRRIGIAVGVPMLIVGTVVALIAGIARRRLLHPRPRSRWR